MPIDPNIILQTRLPEIQSPLDVMSKAMTFKQLAQKSQIADQELADQQALRTAFKNNITMGPDGKTSVNRPAVLSDLYKSNPMQAMETETSFKKMDQDALEQKQKTMSLQTETAKQLAWSIPTDSNVPIDQKQEAWTRARQSGIQYNLPNANTLPEQYPGDQFVNNMKMHTMTASEQLAQQDKNRDYELKKQTAVNEGKKLDVDLFKTFGSPVGQGKAGDGGNSPDTDPAKLVSHHVPPDRQAKVFEEIDAAQNTATNAPKILKAFDDAADNLHAADFVPGLHNADQKALHALLGPTFKDVEGTVRQAAMDNLYANITPAMLDYDNTKKTKRAALVAYLKSKEAAPTAMGYGIDLRKYSSTSIPKEISEGPDGKKESSQVLSFDDWKKQSKKALR